MPREFSLQFGPDLIDWRCSAPCYCFRLFGSCLSSLSPERLVSSRVLPAHSVTHLLPLRYPVYKTIATYHTDKTRNNTLKKTNIKYCCEHISVVILNMHFHGQSLTNMLQITSVVNKIHIYHPEPSLAREYHKTNEHLS